MVGMGIRRSHRGALALGFGVAVLAATAVLLPAGGEAKPAERTAIYDLFGQAQVEPKRIFLTANSGPYIKRLQWSGWGKRRAIGEGIYISDCVSCPPPDRRPAKVVLRKRKPCEKRGGRSYRVGRLKTGADYSGEPKTVPLDTGFWYCKR
jgi:hypothetical protein